MRDQTIWSISLGRWGGVQVRIHIFFLLFAVLTLFLATNLAGQAIDDNFDWAVTSLVILFVSVVWHELWHHRIAHSYGGIADATLLMPWGGISSFRHLPDAKSELVVGLAGPLSNLVISCVCLPILWFETHLNPLSMLHPLQPMLQTSDESLFVTTFAIIFWANWVLFLVNLVPAYPFDGGQILHGILSPALGKQYAARIVDRFARVAAIGLVIAAYLLRQPAPGEIIPMWLALLVLAIFLFFSGAPSTPRPAQEADDEEDVLGYDFSAGYTSLERSVEAMDEMEPSPISQWIEQRRETRHRRQAEMELEEDQLMDEILERLHLHGMESLSDEERELLERVSARYRNRSRDRG